MCCPETEALQEDTISYILLPDRDPIVPETHQEEPEIPFCHLIHLIAFGRVGLHPEARQELARGVPDFEFEAELRPMVPEVSDGTSPSISTSSNTSTEVSDLRYQEWRNNRGILPEEDILANYRHECWSTGADEPNQIQAGQLQNTTTSNNNMRSQHQCVVIPCPCPQPIMTSLPMAGPPLYQQQVPHHLMPYRLVPLEHIGHPQQVQMQTAAGTPQQYGYYGQTLAPIQQHASQAWVLANGTVIGQLGHSYGQHQPSMNPNPMPLYDEGSTRFFEGQQASYYEGRPIVYTGNQSVPPAIPACGPPSLTGLSAPLQMISSSSQWHNQPNYNQVPPLIRSFHSLHSSGYDTRRESSTGLDSNSFSSETSNDDPFPLSNYPAIPLSAVCQPSLNGTWLSGFEHPVTWEQHPNGSENALLLQTPEKSQSGSELYSSNASSSDYTGYHSTPGSVTSLSSISSVGGNEIESKTDVLDLTNDTPSELSLEMLDLNLSQSDYRVRKSNTGLSGMKPQRSENNLMNSYTRPLTYLMDCGTTFYMNGVELPFVINNWDTPLSSKMSRKPSNYEYYVPPTMEDGDFFGGQQPMWQMKMMQYFGKCRPDIWRLQAVPDFQKNANENWINFTVTTKLRFCCRNCKVPWTSKKGKVIFAFRLDNSVRRGWIFMKMFGQVCMRNECVDWSFQTPACYPEEIDRATYKLFEYISYVHYGIPLDPFIFTECEKSIRAGNPKSHHRKEFCQACQQGICQMAR